MKTTSTHAATAKAIRAELKQAFPGSKFSVKSDSYTGGSSVRVSWVDGPLLSEVQAITRKYAMGHFDGMTDMYENSNSRDDVPQVKFVFTDREMSPETRALYLEFVNVAFSPKCLDNHHWSPEAIARRAFNDPKTTAFDLRLAI